MRKSSFITSHNRSNELSKEQHVSASRMRLSTGICAALFVALGSAASASEAVLTWTDNSHDEAGFRVERSESNKEFTVLTETTADVISFVDSSVVDGIDYQYRVCAFNEFGVSGYTNVASYFSAPAVEIGFSYIEEVARSEEPFDLSINMADTTLVESVTYLVEGVEVGVATSAPFTLQALLTEEGDYQVTALVKLFGRTTPIEVADILVVGPKASAHISSSFRSIAIDGNQSYGSSLYDSERDRFILTDGSSRISGAADRFHGLKVQGDFTLTTRLVDLFAVADRTIGGVSVRASLDEDSATSSLMWKGTGKLTHRLRSAAGKTTRYDFFSLEQYVRVVRKGDVVTYYSSNNATSWNRVASSTLPLEDLCYVGFALASGEEGNFSRVEFDTFSIDGTVIEWGSAPAMPTSLTIEKR